MKSNSKNPLKSDGYLAEKLLMNLESIYHFFLPHLKSSEAANLDQECVLRSRFSVSLVLLAIVVFLSFTFVNRALNNIFWSQLDIGMVLILSSLLYFKKIKIISITQLNIFFLAFTSIVIAIKHTTSPATLSTNVLWVPLIILVGYIILKNKIANLLTLFIAVIMSAGSYFHLMGNYAMVNMTVSQVAIFNLLTIFSSVFVAVFIIHRVLAEKSEIKQALEDQIEEVFVEKEEKSALLSLLGHDIANSLFVIGQASKTLIKTEMGTFDDKSLKKMKMVFKHSEIIKEILNQVRAYQAVGTGKLVIKTRAVNLRECLKDVVERVELKLANKNIHIIWCGETETKDVFVEADPEALTNNVLMNILTNAIKFSKKNSVIQFDIIVQENNVQLIVKDFGVGIPPKLLPVLFSKHRPTTHLGTEGEKGTGLGMPIMKMFLDKFNAKVEVESTHESVKNDESGTTFTIHFKSHVEPTQETSLDSIAS
jgi:signal transduction histidine kinase